MQKSALDPHWRKSMYALVDEACKDIVEQTVNPETLVREAAQQTFSRSVIDKLAERGVLGFTLPTEIGGEGRDIREWALFLERLGYICNDNALPLILGLYTAVARTICQSGKPHLLEAYARKMAKGELIGAFAYTDFTDPFSFNSKVTREGNSYILNGFKPMIGGGALADVFMTYVRNERNDLCAFLVEKSDPGVIIEPRPIMGLRSSGLVSLRLENVVLPTERLVAEKDGLSHIQKLLNNERRAIFPASMLGRAQAILEDVVMQAEQIIRYEQPLSQMKNVQARIGRMSIALRTAQTLLYHTLDRIISADVDLLWDTSISITKYVASETVIQIAEESLRILGGKAYLCEEHFERYLRDFYGMIAGGGAQDILEIDIGMMTIENVLGENLG